jgi:uncharacterized protein (TIGR02271 family)
MISTEQLHHVLGNDVVDSSGSKIGKAGQIYLDDSTGQPAWVTVKTGLFGSGESFVPLDQANLSGDQVQVPYAKAQVKDAPRVDDDGHLSPEQEAELYRYYGLSHGYDTTNRTNSTNSTEQAGRGTDLAATTGTTGTADGRDRDGDGVYDEVQGRTVGHDTSGPTTDEAMTRSEEHLRAGTEQVQAGRARLRKYIVTEQQQVSVPVTRDEVRVEREPITDANYDKAMDGPALSEEEHEVVLNEERPVVTTEAVPVERVRLGKETVTEQQTVTGEVRKEVIETDADGGAERPGDPRR